MTDAPSPTKSHAREMRLLELFSGTQSIGRAFRDNGWNVLSLDIDPKAGADITADILTWDYTIYPEGHFDAIWSSPVCAHFSIARTRAKTPRDLVWADSLVAKTIEIINYFKPTVWAWENPLSGLLKDREVVRGFPFKDVTYCKYGFPYRKATRIWTNSVNFIPRPMCCKTTPCESIKDGRHIQTAQRGPGGGRGSQDCCSLAQLYSMPPQLCQELAKAWTEECG